jgi:hypothetical protein
MRNATTKIEHDTETLLKEKQCQISHKRQILLEKNVTCEPVCNSKLVIFLIKFHLVSTNCEHL